MNNPQRKRSRRDDRGSASVELTLLVPVLVVVLALMVIAGRQVSAALITQDAASAAARVASLQRDPASARTHAHQAAERELTDRGVVCAPFSAVVDTSEFEPGGVVKARVACTVSVIDLGGFGGQRTLTATSVSPVDPYRGQMP
ncbi:Flp pilus assembly protein TadG [Nocardiopsis arvandica]|uniref:Flp pilus assembly protein TadG n=1 Tax=Nocardiopsis sinuspersici TaxID=501010 RepID=A0A7Y9X8T9_9ACTN|nr:TadE/TadG family type IV pilus assembly protein [Nocardiopsis sinuspersici]NYH51326.1 Flp pilus assembly protein TadG [Nocardiopsis sinuspersici]